MEAIQETPFEVLQDLRLSHNEAVYAASIEKGLHKHIVDGLLAEVRLYFRTSAISITRRSEILA